MPTALFISPHLDDAVFSAGGTMAALVDGGWRVRMATVFTRSVAGPTGFALRCQTDKGLPADVDYLALRRAEDFAAAKALGLAAADVLHLDLPEAPHRGYADATQLFGGVHAQDAAIVDDIARRIAPLVAAADVVYAPLGVGGHVDHLQVIDALGRVAPRGPVVRWLDAPYVLRLDAWPACDLACDVTATLGRKLDACAAYATQLGFQFGGEPAMRERMTAGVTRPDALVGTVAGAAERFRCAPRQTSDRSAGFAATTIDLSPLMPIG